MAKLVTSRQIEPKEIAELIWRQLGRIETIHTITIDLNEMKLELAKSNPSIQDLTLDELHTAIIDVMRSANAEKVEVSQLNDLGQCTISFALAILLDQATYHERRTDY